MAKETIKIPDMGGADGVEIIEICVAEGDRVEAEDSLLVLESDKASMEVPAPQAGTISKILVKVGDTVSEGDAVFELEGDSGDAQPESDSAEDDNAGETAEQEGDASDEDSAADDPSEASNKPAQEKGGKGAAASRVETIKVPDIGGEAEVIELCVAAGDAVEEGDSLIVLESDKASMEVPSPFSGTLTSLAVKVGDSLSEGSLLGEIEVQGQAAAEDESAAENERVAEDAAPAEKSAGQDSGDASGPSSENAKRPAGEQFQTANPALAAGADAASGPTLETHHDVYAGPAVRKMAREFGIPLEQVKGTGPKGRVVKEDLQAYVKTLASKGPAPAAAGGGALPPLPEVDFAKFGSVRVEARSKLDKLTAANMHRSWVNLPHVTHFDDADITELEHFRKRLKTEADAKGVKATPLPFLLKAVAATLQAFPKFNASLSSDGESIVYKDYVHVGMAVDTPAGLVVPVLRDVDKKSIWQLAAESAELAAKARDRKLSPADMQGGCFTISSLGGIGGKGFSPIINAPELAILGVSRLSVQPVWDGESFQPRQMLPLSLSYDHRAINGADAGQFMVHLIALLGDIRRLLL